MLDYFYSKKNNKKTCRAENTEKRIKHCIDKEITKSRTGRKLKKCK